MKTRLLVIAAALAALPLLGLAASWAWVMYAWARAFDGSVDRQEAGRASTWLLADGSTINFPYLDLGPLVAGAPPLAIALVLPLCVLAAAWPGRGIVVWRRVLVASMLILIALLCAAPVLLGTGRLGELPPSITDESGAAAFALAARLVDLGQAYFLPAAVGALAVPLVFAAARWRPAAPLEEDPA